MVKEIQLQNGMVALVDDEDFDRVNEYLWVVRFINNSIPVISGVIKGKNRYLTHFILGLSNVTSNISFLNMNRFDFRKENLIEINKTSVSRRKKAHRKSSSKYKGVSWRGDSNKWLAKIKVDGKDYRIGLFVNEDEAAKAYNQVAKEIYGEDYLLNVIGIDNRAESIASKPRTKTTRKRGSSGIKGVRFYKGAWRARIWVGGKEKYLGTFNTAEEAAKAYDKEAYEIHGDKAILNFPEEYGTKVKY